MKKTIPVLLAGLLSLSSVGRAVHFDFNVQYQGGGVAALLAGNDPMASSLVAGDTFDWDIQAQGTGFWEVLVGDGFFPLMAFGTWESGTRTGDFTLTLKNNGSDVFSYAELGSQQSFIHIGTNTISLVTGLIFDQMHLSYSLTSSVEAIWDGSDWVPGVNPINTTLSGLLPIFGAPEATADWSNGDIAYRTGAAVPDFASTLALLAGALGLVSALARRTRRA
jgi:hypothetical protein